MEELIARYGLIAVFVGSGIEGEPFALAGGVFAHRQWLSPYAVPIAAILGAFCVDQFWFHLSRNARRARLVRKIVERAAFRRALDLIERHPVRFVLMFRFAYGLRSVAAVAVGASHIPTRRFVALNVLAATVWGLFYTALGYWLGPAFKALEARFGFGFVAVSFALSALVLLFLIRRRHR